MKKETNLDQRISEAIESLKGIEPVQAKPFFYTRLKTRMESSPHVTYGKFSFLDNLKFNVAILAIIFTINMVSFFLFALNERANDPQTGTEALSGEYFPATDDYSYLSTY